MYFIKQPFYVCTVWVPGAVIIKSKKVLKAMYHVSVLLEKVGNLNFYTLFLITKVKTFYEGFVYFSFKNGNNLTIKFWKRFGAK